jgi:hypothetical protein
MPKPAITLEVLPAGYGDCLLISCPVGRRTWRLLVDTGPDECYPALKARLAKLPGKKHGRSRQTQAEAVATAAATLVQSGSSGGRCGSRQRPHDPGPRSMMVPRTDLPANLTAG